MIEPDELSSQVAAEACKAALSSDAGLSNRLVRGSVAGSFARRIDPLIRPLLKSLADDPRYKAFVRDKLKVPR